MTRIFELMELFVAFISAVAWPAALLAVVLLFRKRIERILDRFSRSPYYDIEKEVSGLTEAHVELLKIIEVKRYDFDTVFEHVKKAKLKITTASDLESNLNYLKERGLVKFDTEWKLYSLTRKGEDVLIRIV